MCFETKAQVAAREEKEAQELARLQQQHADERETKNSHYIGEPPYSPRIEARIVGQAQAGNAAGNASENQTIESNIYTRFFPGKPEKAIKLRANLEHSTEHVLEILRERQAELGPEFEEFRENVDQKVLEVITILTQAGVNNEDQAIIAHFLQRVTTGLICQSNASELLRTIFPFLRENIGAIGALRVQEGEDDGFEALISEAAGFGRNRG